jgi:glycosyltransferase involved in cell wall biosynthesis
VDADTSVLVVIPARNEAASVGQVVREVLKAAPKVHVLVVDDASSDATAATARGAGAEVISTPFNLGVGGAMRIGFRYARDHSYAALVQVDGDGQHDPVEIDRLLAPIDDAPRPMVVIGSRFAEGGLFEVPRARRWAMRLLARRLSRMTRVHLTDVTSGYRAHNRAAINLFSRTYPADYLADTVESLVSATQAGGVVTEVPVTMRGRAFGSSSQSSWRAMMYLARVALMLLVATFRRWPARPHEKEAH